MARKRTTDTPQARVVDATTAANKAKFLAAYRDLGNVSFAARTAGISRRSHYQWLDEDAEYKAAFEDAADEAADVLEAEARRRAVDGVEKRVFWQGVEIDTVRSYSDTLLIFLLKGSRPDKFAERHVHGGKGKRGAILLEEIVAGSGNEEK